MDNGTFAGGTVNGLVITHFPPGFDPNTQPSDILEKDFAITSYRDSRDPLAATLFTITANGSITSNLTGTDIKMEAQTSDSTGSRPLTWTSNIADAPLQSPPGSGALVVTENNSASVVAAAVSATNSSGLGDMNMTVINNSLPSDSPDHEQTVLTNWPELLSLF